MGCQGIKFYAIYIMQKTCHHPPAPAVVKGMAHDSVREVAINPGEPGGFGDDVWNVPGLAGDFGYEASLFIHWVIGLLTPNDFMEERIYNEVYIDRRDIPAEIEVSVGTEGSGSGETVAGNELSDLVISEVALDDPVLRTIVGDGSGMTMIEELIAELNEPNITAQRIIDVRAILAALGVHGGLEPIVAQETDVPIHDSDIWTDLGDAGAAFVHSILGHPGHQHAAEYQ